MKSEHEIKSRIMGTVYRMYIVREFFGPVVRVALLGLFALSLKQLISISSVLQNASAKHDIAGFLNYAFSAFVGTQFIVQLIVLGAVLVIAGSAIDLVSSIRNQRALA